jgi:hypothetical protein
MESFVSDDDYILGKVIKYRRINPVGEDMHLLPDGTIVSDEFKIVKAQRIFKHNYWKADGPGAKKVLEKYRSCPANDS